MKILAVIPARGGSKGIPRKNIRLMNKKPLIYYAIHNAKNCPFITDTVVTTDDAEIAEVAAQYGAAVIKRDPALADDQTTLDPVVCDAVVRMEQEKGAVYDAVLTLQPTSPLLTVQTLTKAVESFLHSDFDTYISACNQPHLAWSEQNGKVYPLYRERLNRQLLPPNYVETGAFFLTKRQFVAPNSRMGKRISVYEIPEREAIDIDTVYDWIICENQLKRKKIILRCDGYKILGMGHIYRCLTLAYHLMGHDLLFVTRKDCPEGLQKLKDSYFPCRTIADDEDFFALLREEQPDIVVNDCLDTEEDYIKTLKSLSGRVVTFEDLGRGRLVADAAVNALYEEQNPLPNQYYGEKYIDLRDEFIPEEPITVRENVSNVFVMFGGTDPSNLTERIYRLAQKYTKTHDITFTFVAGLSYNCTAHGILPDTRIEVHQEIRRVTDLMKKADLAFTSQGRTVFELASMGIPSIVLAQNKREQLHTFAQMKNGFLNLGLGRAVMDETIEKTFEWLCSTYEIRKDMNRLMRMHDLKSGMDRIKKIVLGESL